MSISWFFFFKQKTAYEMRISDWSSDVCSSDLGARRDEAHAGLDHREQRGVLLRDAQAARLGPGELQDVGDQGEQVLAAAVDVLGVVGVARRHRTHGLAGDHLGKAQDGVQRRAQLVAHQRQEAGLRPARSEEHTSELQSLMRISYA